MTSRKVSYETNESMTRYVADYLDRAFREGGGITLHVIDPSSTASIVETRAQIRECLDVQKVLSIIHKSEIEYPEHVMADVIGEAISVAGTYGERGLDGIADRPEEWGDKAGFESANLLRLAIEAAVEAPQAGQGELVMLSDPMGAEAAYAVARTSEWHIALENTAEHHFPARVISTLESLRAVLS